MNFHWVQLENSAFVALENKLRDVIEEAKKKEVVEKRKADLVTLLATSQTEETTLSPKEILSDAFIFMFAGHETTAVTLNFCFRLIALNPHVQQKVTKIVIVFLAYWFNRFMKK